MDTTTEVRAVREQDNSLCDAAFARRGPADGSETDSAAAGAALLARLGL
ncbi:MAG: hypothetical protein ACYCV4_11640 [Dermatophilaceae bacterium]